MSVKVAIVLNDALESFNILRDAATLFTYYVAILLSYTRKKQLSPLTAPVLWT